MSETIDKPNVVMHPPIAWALAFVAGLGVGWLYPLRFVPTSVPRTWVGGGVFAVGLVLAIWAIATMRKAGTRIETNKPTTAIVAKNAAALPLHARQTGQPCATCHTAFLELTPFGRRFKLGIAADASPGNLATCRGRCGA